MLRFFHIKIRFDWRKGIMTNQKSCLKKIKNLFCALSGLAFLAAIGCSNHDSGSSKPVSNSIKCEDPRPEMCTQEYVPVCGERMDGSRKTYGNACSACADINVVQYQADPCK